MPTQKRQVEFEINGADIKQKIESAISRCKQKNEEKQHKQHRVFEHLVSILVNALCLYVANHLLIWHVSFLTPDFSLILPILNISLLLKIFIDVLLIAHESRWFAAGLKAIHTSVSLYFSYLLYVVYPFNFSRFGGATLDSIVHLCLIISMIVMAVVILVEFIKFWIYLIGSIIKTLVSH